VRFLLGRWVVLTLGSVGASLLAGSGCSESRSFTPHGGAGSGGSAGAGGATTSAGGQSGASAGAGAPGGRAGTTSAAAGTSMTNEAGSTSAGAGGEAAEGGAAGSAETAKSALGTRCTADAECRSDHCTDGVCCDSACSGQCESCNARGQCGAVSGKPVAPRAACAGTTPCEGTCDGSETKACSFPDSSTLCVAATCDGNSFTPKSVCDGSGACTEPDSRTCANGCATGGSAACAADCTPTSCASGSYCDDASGNCLPLLDTGASCSADTECASASCIARVCCADVSACGGGCTSWSFDSRTTEGWVADTDPGFPVNGGGTTNGVTTSTTTAHDGGAALAVPGTANGQIVSVTVPICRSGSTQNLAGFTLSAWVRLTGTALSPDSFVFFDAWSASGSVDNPVLTGDSIVVLDTWYHLSTTFSSTIDADHVAIRLNPEMSWSGTMYIDSVTLTGP